MIQIENITLLNKNNLAGENKLEVLKNYGLQCELTDLAIITGAIDRDIFYNLDTPYQLTSEFSPKITIIDNHGNLKETTNNVLPNGIIRPVIKLKKRSPILSKRRHTRNDLWSNPAVFRIDLSNQIARKCLKPKNT